MVESGATPTFFTPFYSSLQARGHDLMQSQEFGMIHKLHLIVRSVRMHICAPCDAGI